MSYSKYSRKTKLFLLWPRNPIQREKKRKTSVSGGDRREWSVCSIKSNSHCKLITISWKTTLFCYIIGNLVHIKASPKMVIFFLYLEITQYLKSSSWKLKMIIDIDLRHIWAPYLGHNFNSPHKWFHKENNNILPRHGLFVWKSKWCVCITMRLNPLYTRSLWRNTNVSILTVN